MFLVSRQCIVRFQQAMIDLRKMTFTVYGILIAENYSIYILHFKKLLWSLIALDPGIHNTRVKTNEARRSRRRSSIELGMVAKTSVRSYINPIILHGFPDASPCICDIWKNFRSFRIDP